MINQTLSSTDVLMSSGDNEGNLAKNKKMLVKEKLGGGNFQKFLNRTILSVVISKITSDLSNIWTQYFHFVDTLTCRISKLYNNIQRS